MTSLPRAGKLARHWMTSESIGEWKGREPDVYTALLPTRFQTISKYSTIKGYYRLPKPIVE